jgi:hypothetical protein
MAGRLSRNRFFSFLLECASLSTPRGRVGVFGSALAVLLFMDPAHPGLPDLCFVKKLFGYCPACGTVRALACFFKGRFAEGVKYNLNVILTAPVFCGLFLLDLGRMMKNVKRNRGSCFYPSQRVKN